MENLVFYKDPHCSETMTQDSYSGIPYRPPHGAYGPKETHPEQNQFPPGTAPAGYEVSPLPGGPGGKRGIPADTPPAPVRQDANGAVAPFWRRCTAFLADLMLVEFLAGGLGSMAAAAKAVARHGFNPGDWETAHSYAISASQNVYPWLLFGYLVFFAAYGGRTPGKMMFKLQIRQQKGGTVTWALAVGRTFSYLASVFTWGIGFLLAAGPRGLALHDRISHTRVVYRPVSKG